MNASYVGLLLALMVMAVTAGCDRDSAIDGLAVSARCEPDLQGELRLALSQADGSYVEVQRAPLDMVCLPSELVIKAYQADQSLEIQWYQGDQLKAELVSSAGTDIHAERAGGYRVLLAVSSQPPYLANEAL